MIRFDCPLCGEKMEAPESLRGRPLACPACGELVRVCGVNPVIEEVREQNKNRYRQHPIYEKQHWIIFGIIVISLVAGSWAVIHNNSWENKNFEHVKKLTKAVIDSYEQEQHKETVRNYLELDDYLEGRLIRNSELATLIEQSKYSNENALETLMAEKRANLRAEAQQNYQQAELPSMQESYEPSYGPRISESQNSTIGRVDIKANKEY